MHPLNSARLKIYRANIHINALKRSIARTFNPQHTISEKTISQGVLKGIAKIIDVNIDPSLRAEIWGLIIGDIVTNLRASLDHIAWELAMLHISEIGRKKLTPSEAKRVQFPLYDEVSAMDDTRRGGRALEFILPRAHNEIKRFQPYNRRNWPELHLLHNLELLANTDKHRNIPPCNVQAKVTLTPSNGGVIQILNDKRNSQFIADTGTRLEPNITFTIAVYPDRRIYPPMSIAELSLIHDFIRDEVIPAFSRFFE